MVPSFLSTRIPRRRFLKRSSAFVLAAPILLSPRARGANDRIAIGCIGVGGRGTDDLKAFMREPDAQVVAVCDVMESKRLAAKKLVEERYADAAGQGSYSGCVMFNDFRELLNQKEIDAVSIVTPDHWHVPIGIAAARAGKDLFIEKPLSYTLAEGRLLCRAVQKYARVFQHGTQQRCDSKFRIACELVRNRKIGELKKIIVGSPEGSTLDDQPPMPVPPGFDYRLWLGQAPMKPYTEKRTQTPWWYFISDYTIGYVAGWGVHHIDIAQWGNDTDSTGPIEIEGSGEFPEKGLCDTATAWEVEMRYANGVPLRFTDSQKSRQGVTFEGTEGWVFVNREVLEAKPASLLEIQLQPGDVHLYQAENLQRNLLDCMRSRKPTICSVETAHRTTSICHLSLIAMKVGKKLVWNPDKEQFENDTAANALLSRDVHDPAFPYDYSSL